MATRKLRPSDTIQEHHVFDGGRTQVRVSVRTVGSGLGMRREAVITVEGSGADRSIVDMEHGASPALLDEAAAAFVACVRLRRQAAAV